MKRLFYVAIPLLMLFAANSCKDKQVKPIISTNDSIAIEDDESDSTLYGVCGEATSMHDIQLVTDDGDTVQVLVNADEMDVVKGGLLAGDRMAVTAWKDTNGEVVASTVVNLTSLLGKWTSLDKNFELMEGGEVVNHVKAEQNPWTSWKMLNGKLLLNKDTFLVNTLGPDSLALENHAGIFVFKRQE